MDSNEIANEIYDDTSTINDYNTIDDYTTINNDYITFDTISNYIRYNIWDNMYYLEHHVNYAGLEIYNYIDTEFVTALQYFNIMGFLHEIN
jgi:hypothetical protein